MYVSSPLSPLDLITTTTYQPPIISLNFPTLIKLYNLESCVTRQIQKMTGETLEVRSDKRKQREERGERKKREKKRQIERKREK